MLLIYTSFILIYVNIFDLLILRVVWEVNPTGLPFISWKSFGVVGFDLGPLLQGHTWYLNLKAPITCFYWSWRFGM